MTVTFEPRSLKATKLVAPHAPDLTRGFYPRYGKRALDLTIVVLTLPIILPVLLICAALNIASGHPVFYSQYRLGQNGRVFRIWKLCTMHSNADRLLADLLRNDPARRQEWDTTQKLKEDPRVTRVGGILRRTSLDEIPQLFNVLVGDMSLLGPRPMMLDQVDLYGPSLPVYLSLRPGISGKWQVSERNEAHFQRRAQIDVEYARDLGLLSDLKLVWATLRTLLRSTGY